MLLFNQEEYNKALDCYKKMLKIRIMVYGEYNHNTAEAYNIIGCVYDFVGDYNKALDYFEKAVQIRVNVFGEFDPETAEIYYRIGNICSNIENNNKELDLLGESIELDRINLSITERISFLLKSMEAYFKAKNSCETCACISIGKKEYNKALEYLEKALEIYRIILDDNDPLTQQIIRKIAEVKQKIVEKE